VRGLCHERGHVDHGQVGLEDHEAVEFDLEGRANDRDFLEVPFADRALEAALGADHAVNYRTQDFVAEVKRITNMTEWNGSGILNGTTSEAVYQIGANANQTITVGFGNLVELTGVATAMSTDVTVSTENVITQMDAALGAVDRYRADLGAKINRLTYAADNLTNVSTNSSASRSRILDADYAKASSELARTQIIQQAATAILSQANTSQQTVLKLLQ
jgi:flagellin